MAQFPGASMQARLERRGDQDRRLGSDPPTRPDKEYRRRHMLAPMPLAITLGAGSNPDPTPCGLRGMENINGRRSRCRSSQMDKRDPKSCKGFKFAGPLTDPAQLLMRLLCGRARADPDRTSRSARFFWPQTGDGGEPARRQFDGFPEPTDEPAQV